MKTTIIKEYLKQQYDKYNSETKDAIKMCRNALQNEDEDEVDSQRRRVEYALVRSTIVFDMYKDLTGERIDGKPNDYIPDGVFRSGNENDARTLSREKIKKQTE